MNRNTAHTSLRSRVKALVERNGGCVIAGAASGFGSPGVPDLVCCIEGHSLSIKVKTGTAKLTEHQQRMADRITAAGGAYAVARDIDDVIATIETVIGRPVILRRQPVRRKAKGE